MMTLLPNMFTVFFISLVINPLSTIRILDCPLGWETFNKFCYKFSFFPPRNFQDASLSCQVHGASLLSIRGPREHLFVSQWLQQFSPPSTQWYTDGLVNATGIRMPKWSNSGDNIPEGHQYWIEASEKIKEGTNIVYNTQDKKVGWSLSSGSVRLPYICKVSQSEVYNILQENRDFNYGHPTVNLNDIKRGPNMTIEPMDTIVLRTWKTVFLDCVSDGNPQPTYKWYHYSAAKWQEVTSTKRYTLTNGRLTINRPQEANDAGRYQCFAQNKLGRIRSNEVRLSFGYLGEFSNVRPEPVYVNAYDTAMIVCSTISYKPAISFQWIKTDTNDFIRTEKQKHMFISANGRLYFSEVSREDAGEYRCLVTLKINQPMKQLGSSQYPSRISNGIQLIVRHSPPKVNWGPVIQNDFIAVFPTTPKVGNDVRLECFAQGSSGESNEMIYHWSRDDIPFSSRVKFKDLNRVMTIEKATFHDEGVYRCTVTRSANAWNEKSYYLELSAKPYMVFPLRSKFMDIGSHLTWFCKSRAKPEPTYKWFKNGFQLKTKNDVIVSENSLHIKNVTRKHAGMYQCAATNTHGTTYSNAQLSVLAFKPNFYRSTTPKTILAILNGNATIFCNAEGAPQPELIWSKDNVSLSLENADETSRIRMLPNGNLHLRDVDFGDAGEYECTAINRFGNASQVVQLIVNDVMVISRNPQNTEVLLNETAFLGCDVSYNPRYDTVYQWLFNGVLIDLNNDAHYGLSTEEPNKGLLIRNAKFFHTGLYRCSVKSTIDQVSVDAFLTVKGPPGEPSGLYVEEGSIGRTSVQLRWFPPPDNGFPIKFYVVYTRTNYKPDWQVLVTSIPVKSLSTSEGGYATADIEGLNSDLSYQFKVQAVNIYGTGDLSISSGYYRTKSAPPFIAPRSVHGGGGKVGTLVIRWSPLNPSERSGPGIGYNVFWRLKGSDRKWSKIILKKNADFFVAFVGRNFYLEYEVKVQAFNYLGIGPNSTTHTIHSAEGMPIGVPNNVYAETYNATAMVVTWDPVPDIRQVMKGRVRGYQVNYWNRDEENPVINAVQFPGQLTEALVIGLEPNMYYWVNVQVYNTAGNGPVSEIYLGSSGSEAPLSYPEEVNVHSHGPDTCLVTFRGVSMTMLEDPIMGYKICHWAIKEEFNLSQCQYLGMRHEGIIHGLEKGQLYKLRVLAVSSAGDGKRSELTYFTLGGQLHIDSSLYDILASASFLRARHHLFVGYIAFVHILTS